MQQNSQPIDRETLLVEANKLIRDHEDTLAGIEATGVEQRNGVLVFSGEYFLMSKVYPPPRAQQYLTCSNTWPTRSQRNIT
ncbi:protein YciN [Lelliottia amnigena]|nr:protein YciN [Lelliottia amnigena]